MIKGLFIAVILMIPIIIASISKRIKNKKKKKVIALQADRIMALWGSSLETAKHEDKAMFLSACYITNRHNTKLDGILINKYVCAELILFSAIIIDKYSNSHLADRMSRVLEECFDIHGKELDASKERTIYLQSIYLNQGYEKLTFEIKKRVNQYIQGKTFDTLNENDTIFLQIDNEKKKKNMQELTDTISDIIELINSEFRTNVLSNK